MDDPAGTLVKHLKYKNVEKNDFFKKNPFLVSKRTIFYAVKSSG